MMAAACCAATSFSLLMLVGQGLAGLTAALGAGCARILQASAGPATSGLANGGPTLGTLDGLPALEGFGTTSLLNAGFPPQIARKDASAAGVFVCFDEGFGERRSSFSFHGGVMGADAPMARFEVGGLLAFGLEPIPAPFELVAAVSSTLRCEPKDFGNCLQDVRNAACNGGRGVSCARNGTDVGITLGELAGLLLGGAPPAIGTGHVVDGLRPLCVLSQRLDKSLFSCRVRVSCVGWEAAARAVLFRLGTGGALDGVAVGIGAIGALDTAAFATKPWTLTTSLWRRATVPSSSPRVGILEGVCHSLVIHARPQSVPSLLVTVRPQSEPSPTMFPGFAALLSEHPLKLGSASQGTGAYLTRLPGKLFGHYYGTARQLPYSLPAGAHASQCTQARKT